MHGEEQAATALDEQLRGVYKLYRTFGGEDMEASHAARDYRNSFQYAAIVSSKGALMFEALRKLLGDEKFFGALRSYYDANEREVADLDDLRGALDRKSTRLNSSHRCISYAVFCLKKKNEVTALLMESRRASLSGRPPRRSFFLLLSSAFGCRFRLSHLFRHLRFHIVTLKTRAFLH